MTEYKPGDRVKWSRVQRPVFTFVEYDEGRCTIERADGCRNYDIRPSELTPADPVPDAAVMLVRELCANEAMAGPWVGVAGQYEFGERDGEPACIAFAKYIRANPPQPLTVERVEAAAFRLGLGHLTTALHAALTEQQP